MEPAPGAGESCGGEINGVIYTSGEMTYGSQL